MSNIYNIILLGMVAIVGVFTLDVYLPSIPSMADDFNVASNQICLTFTAFSIAFAISQLFYGMLSDYVGRKIILMTGLAIAAIATLLCVYANSFESLLIARILQAIGISVFVVVNAIIRDLYTGVKAIQIRTFVNTMSGISISIAPTIGSLLLDRYSWRGSFIVSLVLITITFLYALLFFSETNKQQKKTNFSMSSAMRSYKQLFSSKNYLLNIIIVTLAYTIHFSFIVVSTDIFIKLLGFNPLTFGYLMFIYGGIYFLGGFITTFLSRKIPPAKLINLGNLCISGGGILMFFFSILDQVNVLYILLPMSFMTFGINTVRSVAMTNALASIPEQAGLGAAGLNLIQFMFSAVIATVIITISPNLPNLTLSLLVLLCSTSIFALINFCKKTSIEKLVTSS